MVRLHGDSDAYEGAGQKARLRILGAKALRLDVHVKTYGGEDLYPDMADKAAALMHALALNRPFVDGNKRVAAFAAIVLAESNGHELLATPDDLVETTLGPSKPWRFGFANASAQESSCLPS